jgi:predicted XRE-type DNA-binding protein
MKDQSESIKKKLVETIRAEIRALEDSGLTRTKISEKAGVRLSFMSNFMNANDEGMNGLAIPKLIQMASGLDLKIELAISKNES